jgi:hypothetical protein
MHRRGLVLLVPVSQAIVSGQASGGDGSGGGDIVVLALVWRRYLAAGLAPRGASPAAKLTIEN